MFTYLNRMSRGDKSHAKREMDKTKCKKNLQNPEYKPLGLPLLFFIVLRRSGGMRFEL